MKSLASLLFFLISFSLTSVSQEVQISSGGLPPVLSSSGYSTMGYFNISTQDTVRVEECKLSFTQGFESVEFVYFHLDENPHSSWGSEFLTNPLTHPMNHLLNFSGEETLELEYFADFDSAFSGVLELSLTCRVSVYGDPGQFIWTDTVSSSVLVVTSAEEVAIPKPIKLGVSGDEITIPKDMEVILYNFLGQEVSHFLECKEDRVEILTIPDGRYVLCSSSESSKIVLVWR
jgi:hypothetical protein